MNERTRDYYRHHSIRVINQKRRLLTKIYGYENGYDEFPIDGKLGKGKIYYSFPKRRKKVKIETIDSYQRYRGMEWIQIKIYVTNTLIVFR